MAAAENEVQDDLRATIQAAYDEAEKSESADAPVDDKPSRVRDEHGRFASTREPAAEPPPEAPEKPAAAPVEAAQPAEATQAAPATEPPPQSWTPEAKSWWAKLPPESRAYIAAREDQIHREFSKRDADREFARELQRVIAPYEATIRAEGGTPAAAVQSLLNTAYVLRTGSPEMKTQAIRQIAQQFGIDIGAAAQQTGDTPPYVISLQQEIAQLKGQLAQQQQRAEEEAQTQIVSTIEQFRSDPKHAHFDTVRPVMAALIQSGAAKDLEEAYSMAVWARPDLRQTLTASQQAEAQNTKAVKTEEAKRKAVTSVRSGVGGSMPSVNPEASLREQIKAALDEARGRV